MKKARAVEPLVALVACTACAVCGSGVTTIEFEAPDRPDLDGTWSFADVIGHPVLFLQPANGTCVVDPFVVSLQEGVGAHSSTSIRCSEITEAVTDSLGLSDTTVVVMADSVRASVLFPCYLGVCPIQAQVSIEFAGFHFTALVPAEGALNSMEGSWSWGSSGTTRVVSGDWIATRSPAQ